MNILSFDVYLVAGLAGGAAAWRRTEATTTTTIATASTAAIAVTATAAAAVPVAPYIIASRASVPVTAASLSAPTAVVRLQ
jgi:hypothetical protein